MIDHAVLPSHFHDIRCCMLLLFFSGPKPRPASCECTHSAGSHLGWHPDPLDTPCPKLRGIARDLCSMLLLLNQYQGLQVRPIQLRLTNDFGAIAVAIDFPSHQNREVWEDAVAQSLVIPEVVWMPWCWWNVDPVTVAFPIVETAPLRSPKPVAWMTSLKFSGRGSQRASACAPPQGWGKINWWPNIWARLCRKPPSTTGDISCHYRRDLPLMLQWQGDRLALSTTHASPTVMHSAGWWKAGCVCLIFKRTWDWADHGGMIIFGWSRVEVSMTFVRSSAILVVEACGDTEMMVLTWLTSSFFVHCTSLQHLFSPARTVACGDFCQPGHPPTGGAHVQLLQRSRLPRQWIWIIGSLSLWCA